MQQSTIAVSTVPAQTAQIVTSAMPQSTLNVPVIRGLGITQIVFGILTIIFGIVATAGVSEFWVNQSGSGIWFGIWITFTGVIGVLSARQPTNVGLNGTNMGFNICCTVVSFFVGIFFAVALAHFNNCSDYWYPSRYCKNASIGTAMYGLLTLLMVAEFFVSLTISIYCCQGSGCCGAQTTGVIIQQQPAAFTGQTVVTTNTGYPQGPYPGTIIPPPYSGNAHVFTATPQQIASMQTGMMATNTTYSAQQQPQDFQKPPPYTS